MECEEPANSILMEDACNQVPEELKLQKAEHGYHQDCHQGFTKNVDCLKSSTHDSETVQRPRTSGHCSTASEKAIFKQDYIFSNNV